MNLIVPGRARPQRAAAPRPALASARYSLEGNRTAWKARFPESALPGALAVLGQLKAWSVASDYRDWYNQLADEP